MYQQGVPVAGVASYRGQVDNRAEVKGFLTTRRGRITPQEAGLPLDGQRRVPGLRRGEVASLAGVSIEYYSKLERGYLAGVSPQVLNAIATVLRLDAAEREYLFNLADAADDTPKSRGRNRTERPWVPGPGMRWALDAIRDAPAAIGNGRTDLLASNHLGRALFSPVYADPSGQPNFARFTFLDPAARDFYPDWDWYADTNVAMLRTEAGRNPRDRRLQQLVGELCTRSDEFRRRWGAHDVRIHATGTKHFHHPVVGDLTLAYEGLDLAGEPGLAMTIFAPEPGSASEQAVRLLGSWAATEFGTAEAASDPVRS